MKKEKNKKTTKKLSYEKPVLKNLAVEPAHGAHCGTGSAATHHCRPGGSPGKRCSSGTGVV
jgi:SynChlorMet cassette protein ScmA